MTTPPELTIAEELVVEYQRRGAVRLPGAFVPWIETLGRGVETNLRHPGPYAAERTEEGEAGRFFEDYCNWSRIPEYRDFVWRSPAAAIAARFMGSRTAQFFHEHVLIKDVGTAKCTPWHQDLPYYCVDGTQTLSIWIALDPVPVERCPQFVAGSHLWPKLMRPNRWVDERDFYESDEDFADLPDIDGNPDQYDILQWELAPGDALCFSFRTLHGAPGNSAPTRRRGFSARWVGDDVRFIERPGRAEPRRPFRTSTSPTAIDCEKIGFR